LAIVTDSTLKLISRNGHGRTPHLNR